MLIRLSKTVLYNAVTGEWIRYEVSDREGKSARPLLVFEMPAGRGGASRWLFGDEAQAAWQVLGELARAQRRVLEHQHDLAVAYGISGNFD